MHFSESLEYPAPIDTVDRMLADPDYIAGRFDIPGVLDPDTSVSEEDGRVTSTFTSHVDTDKLPDIAARFVKSDTTVTITETWEPRQGDTRRGTLSVKVSGIPVKLEAQSVLTAEGETTKRTVEGDLEVKIPLVGKRVEAKAVEYVPRLLAFESDAARAYLESHPE